MQEKEKIKGVIVIGTEGPVIKKSLIEAGFNQKKIIDGKGGLLEIVSTAYEISDKGDLILLSPACASFDMFKNYKDRGEKFKKAVSDLSLKLKTQS